MLYSFDKKDLCKLVDEEGIFYGEGRSETGVCLHIPLKNHTAGSASNEDHSLMLTLASNFVEYLLYKRPVKSAESWDYDGEKAGEMYAVCGDNPTTSGIVIKDKNSDLGAKLQIILDKTFGANEIAIKWKNNMVGDENLLKDYMDYLKQAIRCGELAIQENSSGSPGLENKTKNHFSDIKIGMFKQ
jgi:hypothetical protein